MWSRVAWSFLIIFCTAEFQQPHGGARGDDGRGSEVHRLDFSARVQNLKAFELPLLQSPDGRVTYCETLGGELRFGRIPYRRAKEKPTETNSYINFVAKYATAKAQAPAVLFDFDQDRHLGCQETFPLVRDPRDQDKFFRTVILRWDEDGGPNRSQRARLVLPSRLEDEVDFYEVELVDVPTAEWAMNGTVTSWMLLDGNADALHDRSFGDGILVDLSGRHEIDVDPYGENFFSYHRPLQLPWGTYEVAELDRQGRFMVLARARDSKGTELRTLDPGDTTSESTCETIDGRRNRIGGPLDRHQLVYFWLSTCAGCSRDMNVLAPILERLGTERLSAVGVSLDGDPERFAAFVAANDPAWPQCFVDARMWDHPLAHRFGIRAGSDFVILEPGGHILARDNGAERLKAILAQIFPDALSVDLGR